MKKYLYLFAIIFSGVIHSQSSGITYQAVIYNPGGEELPGENNMYAPLTEQDICLRFNFIDSSGGLEYQEVIQVTTDVFGMVNVIIGNDVQTGGYADGFNGIVWDGSAKNLMVEVDVKGNCSDYDEISNQPFTYIPFAYYSANPGNPGADGQDGLTAYQIWISLGNTGTEQEFIDSLSGSQGEEGEQGIPGIGADGLDGLSAYEVWINLGNNGTEQEFMESLVGPPGIGGEGLNGLSAYEVWINLGNTGTEQEFMDSLAGEQGETGEGLNSLIKTSDEEAGDNCENGGIKIETGLDTNGNGELDEDEVDDSLTKYLCNGIDGDGGSGSGESSGNGCDVKAPERIVEWTTGTSLDTQSPAYVPYYNNANSNYDPWDWASESYNGWGFAIGITNSSSFYNWPTTSETELTFTKTGIDSKEIKLDFRIIQGSVNILVKSYDSQGDLVDVYSELKNIKTNTQSGGQQGVTINKGIDYINGTEIKSGILTSQYGNGTSYSFSEINIFSNKLIDKIEITVTHDSSWSSSSYESRLDFKAWKFSCVNSTGSDADGENGDSIDSVPPSDLSIGDLWGGGVVTYIAQPNDLLYVEGEIHGLVAPLNWLDIGGTSNPLGGWPSSASQAYRSQAMAEIGGGEFNTYLYFSIHPNNTNNDPNYWDGQWTGSYGFCLNLELNGYDDWFVPNQNEMMTLLNLSSNLDQLSEAPPYPSENFANDLNHGYYEGYYIVSGSYYPSYGVLPGAINHQPGSTTQGWERTVPMRYF